MRVSRLLGVALMAGIVIPTGAITASGSAGAATKTELGINVMVYDAWPSDADALTAANQTFTYLQNLGANAVALNFSFSMSSDTSSVISANAVTPAPTLLGSRIDAARAHGLTVELRPLLVESTISPSWRGSISPSDPTAWFASYQQFLAPYVALATTHQVHRFVVGAELESMLHFAKPWKHLVKAFTTTTSTTGTELSFDGNWEPVVGVAGIGYGMDFYQPVLLQPGATGTVRSLQRAMHANLTGIFSSPGSTAPVPLRKLVLSEVGIAAVRGAWVQPYNTFYGKKVAIRRAVQANWFTAACQEAKVDHLKGIYFWTVFLAPWKSTTEDDSASPYEWVGTASADAIRTCFTAP